MGKRVEVKRFIRAYGIPSIINADLKTFVLFEVNKIGIRMYVDSSGRYVLLIFSLISAIYYLPFTILWLYMSTYSIVSIQNKRGFCYHGSGKLLKRSSGVVLERTGRAE